jgi:hypothetical protein
MTEAHLNKSKEFGNASTCSEASLIKEAFK